MRKKNTLINRQSAHMSISAKPDRSTHEIKIAFANVTIVVSAVFCVCYFPFLVSIFSIHNNTIIRVRVMVFYDTFNNMSVISLLSVLLVEETGMAEENHRPVASH